MELYDILYKMIKDEQIVIDINKINDKIDKIINILKDEKR